MRKVIHGFDVVHGLVDIFEKYTAPIAAFFMVTAVLVGTAAIYWLMGTFFEKCLQQTLGWPMELAVSMVFAFLTFASAFAMAREDHKTAAIVDAVFSFVFASLWADFFVDSFQKLVLYTFFGR